MTSLTTARRNRTRRLPRVNKQSNDHFVFKGGLNLIDSPLSAAPGQCQNALNYEMGFAGGYRRIGGYRSFDGTPYGDGEYAMLGYGATSDPAIPLGITIDGDSSGAAGELLTYTIGGGFGVNTILQNETLEESTPWTTTRITVTDGDLVWNNGVTATLSKIESL